MSAPFLLVFQVLAHASLLCSLLWLTPADWLVVVAVYAVTGCLGMTVTYHRLLSHKSWKAPTWARVIGMLVGVWGLTGSPIAWVAIHRQHHRFTDTERDPHSPLHMKWWRVQWFSMMEPVDVRYAVDLLRDRVAVALHRWYEVIHVAILVMLLLVFGLKTTMVWYLTPAAILWNAGSLVNTLCHNFGSRTYQTRDSSRNFWPLGLLIFGEGFHNNHHGNPGSARFGLRWWELDLGYLVIQLLRRSSHA